MSVLYGEQPDNIYQLLRFYLESGDSIFDITYGLIIYIRTCVGIFKNKTTPQTAHGFYLIFKSRKY